LVKNLPPDWGKLGLDGRPDTKEREHIVTEMLLKESDRGCAIFGAQILADDLESLLRTHFRSDDESVKKVVNPLFATYAPLSSFSAKIQVAYAIRLITKGLKHHLDVIRRLRNEFAHEAGPIDFDDPRCRDKLRILTAEGKPQDKTDGEEPPAQLIGGQMLTRRQFTNRVAFIIAVAQLSERMLILRHLIREGHDVHLAVKMFEEGGR
jgi:DNA-binding MltR family transcriptional regulator